MINSLDTYQVNNYCNFRKLFFFYILGKTMKDAKFVRRGLHMTSSDKNDQQGGALNFTSGRPALRYDSDSTTNSLQLQKQHVRKPPR